MRSRRPRRVTPGKVDRAFVAIVEIMEADDYREVIPSRYQNDVALAAETLAAVQAIITERWAKGVP